MHGINNQHHSRYHESLIPEGIIIVIYELVDHIYAGIGVALEHL